MIRVLAVASEVFPLVKTGGLADVTGALPAALAARGAEVTTMIPGYPPVMQALADAAPVHAFPDLFGGPARVLAARAGGLALLVLDAPHLYGRPGNPYLGPDGREWPDNALRFAGLGAAAAAIAAGQAGQVFDILHAHDWQAALAPVYLHHHPGDRPGTVLTVHNLAFQGRYAAAIFPRLGLPGIAFGIDGLEYHGDVNFLKGGLCFADRLTTVSPTYAREITTPENGMGLDGVLRGRSADLTGILNGIDDAVWNPASDPLIASRFSPHDLPARAQNRVALRQRFGLKEDGGAVLIGVVSRMTTQKGLDLLLAVLPGLVAQGMQLAMLGSGDAGMQAGFQDAARRYPGSIGCAIGYDEPLAHLIQAGSDALLVPSRFEPCGLTQLYALRYGNIPVVSRVGGLADSVIDANEAAIMANCATGLQFAPVTAEALWDALLKLRRLWQDRRVWERMQRNGMGFDVSWKAPAEHYRSVYDALMAARS